MDWAAIVLLFMISWMLILRWIGETDFTGEYHPFYAIDIPGVFPCLVLGFFIGICGLVLASYRHKRLAGLFYFMTGFVSLYAFLLAHDYMDHLYATNPENEYVLDFGSIMAAFVGLAFMVIGIIRLIRPSRKLRLVPESDEFQRKLEAIREVRKERTTDGP